ncbi:hypothetical protein, partial [Pseudomonas syringae]|uniref:hypothetical protein n=1 Tax=Pseudomonas syringae TaxID=317 RepID=UPI0034D7B4EA
FRTIKKEKYESYSQLDSKQAQYFESWCKVSEVTDFQQLKNLIQKEQFYQQVPLDYKWIMQDRNPETSAQAAIMVDQLITLKEGFKVEEGVKKETRQSQQPFKKSPHSQPGRGFSVENTAWRMAGAMQPN